MLRLNQEKKSRIGSNWKINQTKGEQEVKTQYFSGTKQPLKNNDPSIDFGNSNAFRARPLKHPRLQYGTLNDNVSTTKNPMFVMDRPGGATITDKKNTLCNNNNGPSCCNSTLVPNYRIAIQEPRDCLNKCNTLNNCVNNQKNALQRVRGGALLKNPLQIENGDEKIRTYYSNSTSYLKNRVKMNTNTTNACQCSNSNSVKATRIFNPNNTRFNVQGAVSSGTRIADLTFKALFLTETERRFNPPLN